MSIETELLKIKGTNEFLVPEEAEAWARQHPRSDLHASLEWDNDKAGYQFRLWQIRRLIAVHIRTEGGVRTMLSLSIDRHREGGGYRSVVDILARRDLHEVLLSDSLSELDRIQIKYSQIKELEPVWRARDTVRRRHQRKKSTG
jgi:hypothetical protein